MGFEYYEQQGAAPLGELDMPTQLAILLAHEKLQGPDSFYEPYIACLPARPPNAWAMSDAELDAALAALQCDVTPDWREDAVKTRSLLETHAQGEPTGAVPPTGTRWSAHVCIASQTVVPASRYWGNSRLE